MLRVRKLLFIVLSLAVGLSAYASEGGGVPSKAPRLFDLGPLPITNSMLTSWVVSLLLLLVVRLAVKTPRLVPSRGQAVIESLVETLRELFEPIVGKKAMPAAFPLLLCFFVFILLHNWSGLLPGYIGVYQINCRIPGSHLNGDGLPITVKIGGVSSPASGVNVPLVSVQ